MTQKEKVKVSSRIIHWSNLKFNTLKNKFVSIFGKLVLNEFDTGNWWFVESTDVFLNFYGKKYKNGWPNRLRHQIQWVFLAYNTQYQNESELINS